MSDIPDAIGTASEGGLYAQAVSSETGAGPVDETGHFAEQACLNCGTELKGSHCHACGQKAHLHRTLAAVGHDLVHGVLHLDGKLWHTLPLLARDPGKLTRRYIDGERAYFVSPMALFLFTVFLMFAVFQAVGLTAPSDLQPTNASEVRNGMEDARSALVAERDDLVDALENASGAQSVALRERLRGVEDEIDTIDTGRAVIFGDDTDESRANIVVGADSGGALMKKIGKKWRENPGLMLYKLQANSYKFSWLLIPLSLPFVWLLFAWKRRFKAYDHAVFVTYSLSFMSLMFIALSLLGKAGLGATWLFTIFATIAPLHIYRQLRQAYGLSRWSALWRLLVLLVAIFFVMLIFLQILLLLGAF